MWNVDKPLVHFALDALYLISLDFHLAQERSGGCETAFSGEVASILAFETICNAWTETMFDYCCVVIFVGESFRCIVSFEDDRDGRVMLGVVG